MPTSLFETAKKKVHALHKLLHVTLWPTVLSGLSSTIVLAVQWYSGLGWYTAASVVVSMLCWWVSYCRGREYYLLLTKLKATNPFSREITLQSATQYAKSSGRKRVVDMVQRDLREVDDSFTAVVLDLASELIGTSVKTLIGAFTAGLPQPQASRTKRVATWFKETFTVAPY